MKQGTGTLVLSGTYTVDPMAGVLDFWASRLGLDVRPRIAPYGQVFQQLLDPSSLIRSNTSGANVILVRWPDLAPAVNGADWAPLQARLNEFVSALTAFDHKVPCLVVLGPSDEAQPLHAKATDECMRLLSGVPSVFVQSGETAMRLYSVARVHDPESDRFGHVPYTDEGMAALATTVARWYSAIVRRPVKVIATDADNTLWGGVLGEDGPAGLRMDGPYAALQATLAAQTARGRLVCILSKNEDVDVLDLFAQRPDMTLRREHVAAHRIDWNPKSANLRSLAAELELGADSFLVLDDNPVECAELRRGAPGAITVQVPSDPDRLEAFVAHLWPLDQLTLTDEDRRRAQMYKDNANRAQLRRSASSLDDFLKGLELVVDVAAPAEGEIPRLSQLTQRTNQFNASLLRIDEPQMRRDLSSPATFSRRVRVRDRFGDYGIVGQMRARANGTALEVDLFMLSCRALGRGIEHRMLATLGQHALESGLSDVALYYRHGDRNGPVRRFLDKAFNTTCPASGEAWLRLPAAEAAALAFEASQGLGDVDEADESSPSPKASAQAVDEGELFGEIATSLTTAAAVVQAMSRQVRQRPELTTGFVAPREGLEREIARIWQEVLRVEPIGAADRFQDLGGKSIHLVAVHRLLLERLHVDIDITALFMYGTVSLLAAHLSKASSSEPVAHTAAADRAGRMRAAKARAAERFGVRR